MNLSEIIKEVECLIWAIVFIVALYAVLKHFVLPIIKLHYERQMKDAAHTREKEWADFDKVKASTDEQLKKENKDLKNQLELEKLNQTILNKQLETYKSFISALNLEIKPKAENSKKE